MSNTSTKLSTGKILLSGVKPTGRPHIGNYFGAMRQFVELQDEYEPYIFIADLHALTTLKDKKELEENTLGVLIDYLAIGLDPKKVTLYKQSDVPQVTELAWIFNCLLTVPQLERAHAYKDAVASGKEPTVGLFDYPVLMAADILLPSADVVPVGKDQEQHIEYARDAAQKFNNAFGETFKIPESRILEGIRIVPGTDGQKMSKSYNNVIPLFATDEEIEDIVMKIETGMGGTTPPNLYNIHELINMELDKSPKEFDKLYGENKNNYKVIKEALIEDLKAFIKPLREKREALEKDKDTVLKILKEGGEKARERAEKKMEEVREKVGLKLY